LIKTPDNEKIKAFYYKTKDKQTSDFINGFKKQSIAHDMISETYSAKRVDFFKRKCNFHPRRCFLPK